MYLAYEKDGKNLSPWLIYAMIIGSTVTKAVEYQTQNGRVILLAHRLFF